MSWHPTFTTAALVAAVFAWAAMLAPTIAQSGKRSGLGPCRQGTLAIMAMLDAKEDNTADYRHAYDAVVQSCSPVTAAPKAEPAPGREKCGELALAMLDAIEDGKMNTPVFVQARGRFAQACAPR
jgi:hypothetical protein